MADILSQAEIDALLSAMSSGELDTEQMQQKDEKKVKNYDFSSPTKFSKDHLRTLEIIYEHYARLLDESSGVSAQERAGVGNRFGSY